MEDIKPCVMKLKASVEAYAAKLKEEWTYPKLESSEKTSLSHPSSSSYSGKTSKDDAVCSAPVVLESVAFEGEDCKTDKNVMYVGDPEGQELLTSPGESNRLYYEEEKGVSAENETKFIINEEVGLKGTTHHGLCRAESGLQKPQALSDCDTDGENCRHASATEHKQDFSSNLSLKSLKKRTLKVKHHRCDVCQKGFAKFAHLADHQKIHSGSKPFRCDICNKSFARKGSVAIHLRTHSGEKPYKCDNCPKSFGHKSDLIVHQRAHSGNRPYKCDSCDKSFVKCGDLKRHLRIHSGDRLYQCDLCEKTFARSSSLTVHKRIHSTDRPFKCNVCDKSFVQSGHLVKHKRGHSRDRLYVVICGLKAEEK